MSSRLDKMIEQHQIQFINTTRESTAGYAADAYARMTGLGVACITYGVGINIPMPWPKPSSRGPP